MVVRGLVHHARTTNADQNHERSDDNIRRLKAAAKKQPLRIVSVTFPRPVIMNGGRLPASYANFYIANGVVLVPTFQRPNDRVALTTESPKPFHAAL